MHEARLKRLRSNAALPGFAAALAALRQEASHGLGIPYEIGAVESGQWTHFYHCHRDGAPLTFDWQAPALHRCPACGEVYSGEPFDSCWTAIAHNRIGRAVYHTALLHVTEPGLSGLELVKRYLLAYAEHYAGYPVHGKIPYNGPGKLFAQTLDEAHWIQDSTKPGRCRGTRSTPCSSGGNCHRRVRVRVRRRRCRTSPSPPAG